MYARLKENVMKEKLIVIDGNSLMYRAFFALPGMTNKNGVPTGAIFGFINMLLKLLDYEPSYMAVAFDMKTPTFRHLKYDEYKAGRAQTPPELSEQMKNIRKLLDAMHITVVECEGFEADDILGTLARQAEKNGIDTLLVTGDKDALQLINEHTHVIMTKKGISEVVEYDEAVLLEKYGLSPARMVDLKGLMGDPSDNLPGVKGVGEKTALKLLEKYGTLEETLTRGAVEEKGALQKKLAEGAESAKLSYFLGTIVTDAPIPVEVKDCAFDKKRMRDAVPLLSELQMRTTIERLPESNGAAATEQRTYARITTEEITSIEEVKAMVEKTLNAEKAAIYTDEIITVAIDENTQYSIKTGSTLLEAGLDIYDVYTELARLFESKSVKKIVFDAKKLMHTLDGLNIKLNALLFDAMIAEYLLNAVHSSNTLKELLSERQMGEPCAAALMRVYEVMQGELSENGLLALYNEVELPLIEVLFDMERTGFCVDKAVLSELSSDLAEKKKTLEAEVYAMAGCEFNIQSPKQLSDVLFSKLQLPPPRQKTKQGFSTGADVLENYEADYPIVKAVLDYRFVSKLKSTFTDGLLQQINPKTGRVHTTFNQNVTATGRISSTEPNLQNIPTRTEAGREIRRALIASEGNLLVDADYSQIELRVLAHMSNDDNMIEAFCSGEDIHTKTASEVFGTDNVTREMRSAAKAVNFGIVYGISDFGLAKQLGIPRKTAAEYIRLYLERYPGVKAFMHNCVEDAKEKGFAVTLLGRRRALFELKSSNYNTRSFGERIAMNMPVQGTAADIIKIAMVNVYRRLREEGLKSKLVLQVHDELIVDAPKEEADRVKTLLKDCMEAAYKLKVPLIADANTGKSWYDTK